MDTNPLSDILANMVSHSVGWALLHCWWEYRLAQPLWKAVWRYFKILKMEFPYDPAIPLVGNYLEKSKTLIWKNKITPMFITVLFTITKIWNCPWLDEWIKQLWDIYTMEYYLAIKKKKILSFAAAWRDMESIMLSEISQSQKDKYHMISLICGI